METAKQGHEKKSQAGNASGNCGNSSLPGDPLLSLGLSESSPGGHLPTPPLSSSSTAAPFLSPGAPRAAVRGGRGTVARSRWGPVSGGAPRESRRCRAKHVTKNEYVLKMHNGTASITITTTQVY